MFIPIREHIDLTKETEIDVHRTICRKRSLIVHFVKSTFDQELKTMQQPVCILKDQTTGFVLENTNLTQKSRYCTFRPKENTCMHQVEVSLRDASSEVEVGSTTKIFDATSGLNKIEESYLFF